jgi:hypothetical protein
MLRRILLSLGVVALLLPVSTACSTREPVMWSWPHHKRRIMTVLNGFHRFHMDVDRIVFDMEEMPIETEF